ncbi:MAG TPA: hypothetical protein ENJ30_12580 [Desulfobulbaceae bacterium]|nr:hypothetical protein [Desulfobulbaceae bacterium]
MEKTYPRIVGYRRRPKADKDGGKGYGKPCVMCGKNTCGEKWVQYSYMRGDDETVRVCAEHWKVPDEEILHALEKGVDWVESCERKTK